MEYYTELRQSHKLFEKPYQEYADRLIKTLAESDKYFYSTRTLREKIVGYSNVGIDLCNGQYCGNTILCAMYCPWSLFGENNNGASLRRISVIAGRMADYFGCRAFRPFLYDDENNKIECKDYHFFKKCPLKEKTELDFVLFSILCSINYVTVFIENFFTEEIPQKFKFAYLQYYYLCDFVKDMNNYQGTKISIDKSLKNRELRNCLAHYGLGNYLEEKEIIRTDVLKGLTVKAFHLEYAEAKHQLFECLNRLGNCIQNAIFD